MCGDTMNVWKSTRWAAAAPAMLLALALAAGPQTALAQGSSTPAAPTTGAQPAPAPDATPAGKQVEVVDNPYGLEAMWKGGDIVLKITLGILVFMSVGSWYVIITKAYEQAKMRRQAKAANRTFWDAESVQEGTARLKGSSPFRFIAESGVEATKKHSGLLGGVSINEWISMSIQRAIDNVQSRMQDGLAFLATVGSTAPF